MTKRIATAGPPAVGKGEEIIAGRHPVLAALRRGRVRRLYLAEGLRGEVVEQIRSLSRAKNVPLQQLRRGQFSVLAEGLSGHQGVAALVPSFQYLSLGELIASAGRGGKMPFLVMLDHLEDPQNLGAVMRTANAAGVDGLIIPGRRAAPVTAAVRRVAAGAAETLPVALAENLNRAAARLKSEGFWLYGAEADGGLEYYRADYRRPLVLVIGSEGKGVSQLLRRNCDQLLSIPMPGDEGTLNAASAAAILIYAALAGRMGWFA